jgi:hypothetical protein
MKSYDAHMACGHIMSDSTRSGKLSSGTGPPGGALGKALAAHVQLLPPSPVWRCLAPYGPACGRS